MFASYSKIGFIIFSMLLAFNASSQDTTKILLPDFQVVQRSSTYNYTDSTKTLAAGRNYSKSKFGRFIFGDHYRSEWLTPVEIRYLDLENYAGGLTPLRKGGGKQTISLRFLGADSLEYTARSIDKDPSKAVPIMFRGTVVTEVLQDQISSAHPYGALAVPPLAEATGVFHTNPEIVYIPDSPLLNEYQEEFADMLVLLELRPDGDLSEYERLGNITNSIGTPKMLDELYEDNDNSVDQEQYLRSRLLDWYIGDWDRHDDQWRWGEVDKPEGGKLYLPIPRDRDQVFVQMDGLLPYLWTKSFQMKKIQHFGSEAPSLLGIHWQARNLDRLMLNQLEKSDWERISLKMVGQLTDEVIEKAMAQLPPEVYPISGETIENKLKARREFLVREALKYYDMTAGHVFVPGSEDDEFFDIERLPNGKLEVSVFKLKNDALQQEIFNRVFDPSETKEVWIYGLDGNDKFHIRGEQKEGIKLRISGGEGQDDFLDESLVEEGRKMTTIYDTDKLNNTFVKGENTKLRIGDNYMRPFNYHLFDYNYFGPQFLAEFNVDDGLYLGAGILNKRFGYRQTGYQTIHKTLLSYGTATRAFDLRHSSYWYSIFGNKFDLGATVRAFGPRYVFNYFGQGNETEWPDERDIDFYRIGLNRIKLNAFIQHRYGQREHTIGGGPVLEVNNPGDPEGTIFETLTEENEFVNLSTTVAAGAAFFHEVNLSNHIVHPTRGIKWRTEANYLKSIRRQRHRLHQLKHRL